MFVMGFAAAYAAWYQSPENHRDWLDKFEAYIGRGQYLQHPPSVRELPDAATPMQLIYVAPNFIYSPAHAGTEYVTLYRHQTYNALARRRMEAMGIPVVDGSAITKSHWESAYDGLHYLQERSGQWRGSVANMVHQVVMNVIFPTCVTG